MKTKPRKPGRLAGVFLTLFFVLILTGVAMKRMAHHAEFVIFFHLPAAVCLVMGGIEMKKKRQGDYDAEVAAARKQFAAEPED